MASRQREWAEKATKALRQALGGHCVDCGKKRRKLEFDCIKPMGHAHHRMEWSWRISFYRQQFAAGNLALRCSHCHQIKTNRQTYFAAVEQAENNPF
jgi:hypothetical protein